MKIRIIIVGVFIFLLLQVKSFSQENPQTFAREHKILKADKIIISEKNGEQFLAIVGDDLRSIINGLDKSIYSDIYMSSTNFDIKFYSKDKILLKGEFCLDPFYPQQAYIRTKKGKVTSDFKIDEMTGNLILSIIKTNSMDFGPYDPFFERGSAIPSDGPSGVSAIDMLNQVTQTIYSDSQIE